MRALTENGYTDAVGLFFELTDEQLEIVKDNKNYYQDKQLLDEFSRAKGVNAHFCGVCNNGEAGIIGKAIELILGDYKTVSWWDKDMTEFVLKRRN